MGGFRFSNLQDEIPCGDPTGTIPWPPLRRYLYTTAPNAKQPCRFPITKVQALSDLFDPLPTVRRP